MIDIRQRYRWALDSSDLKLVFIFHVYSLPHSIVLREAYLIVFFFFIFIFHFSFFNT